MSKESDMRGRDPRRYDDIIDLARPVSKKHRPMPIEDRAAQFAPFAALTGYTQAVQKTEEEFHYEEGVEYSGFEDGDRQEEE